MLTTKLKKQRSQRTNRRIAYCIYTIGTLIVAPATLNVGAAIAGLAAVLVMAGVVVGMIINTNKKLKAEYALSK